MQIRPPNITKGLIISIVIGVLTACHQKDLIFPEDDTGILDIRFVWSRDIESDVEGMTLYFFPRTVAEKIWRFDLVGRDGGFVKLPYGTYSLLAYNNDITNVVYDNRTSIASLTAYLLKSETGIVKPLSRPLTRGFSDLDFTEGEISYTDGDVLINDKAHTPTLINYPERISTHYNIIITDIEESERISSATLYLNGVAEGLSLLEGTPIGESVSVATAFQYDPSDNSLFSDFDSFRCLDDEVITVDVIITTKSGEHYKKRFDVSREVHTASDPLYIIIEITGLNLPKEPDKPEEGVDMSVNVDGWSIITIDYITDK